MSAIPNPPTIDPSAAPGPRRGLRLSWVEHPGRETLDGAWWPHSRDLTRELRELSEGFPRERGRITRVGFSRPDWDTAPRKVDLGTRFLEVGSFPNDDTHILVVQTGNRERFTLLVIPPSFTPDQGEEALLAASTPGNSHTGSEVLREVTDQHDADPADLWTRAEDGTPGGLRSHG